MFCFVLFFNVPITRALMLYIAFMLAECGEDAMFVQAAVLPLQRDFGVGGIGPVAFQVCGSKRSQSVSLL